MNKLLICILAALALCSCGGKEKTYPRATAYPRAEIYDSAYRLLPDFPIPFYINASAHEGERTVPEWRDVRYPLYNATLHLSCIEPAPGHEEAEVQSRIERMVMNIGGAAVSEEEFYSADSLYRVLIFHEPGYTPTPVQFVAFGNGRLTTGVFAFDSPAVAADSVAPIVQAVVRDIRYTFLTK
ncbi:MAG: hypothetical protein K2H84_09605 [Paramuribaculum sp.]|nr:hypothetical protein [Paramuribaculum sp.]